MGYRNYIAPISKEEYKFIKNFTKEELYEYKKESLEDGYVGVYDIPGKSIIELGKYVDKFSERYFKPVFMNMELQKYYEQEHDFYIVGKEFLEEVIKRYEEEVRNHYKEMLEPFYNNGNYSDFLNSSKKSIDPESDNIITNYDYSKLSTDEIKQMVNIFNHMFSMAKEWGVCTPNMFEDTRPYSLDSGNKVTTSWKYEYNQFELVRIYKSFDWEKYHMIYYGY